MAGSMSKVNTVPAHVGQLEREGAITAAHFGDIPHGLIDAQSVENQGDIEQGFPIVFLGHAAVRNLHAAT